jgi:2-oxoglutarate/2-oxoacid ferredoxin oxidoreductase subunit alpha
MSKGYDFVFAIGGAAGQGIATPGNILARIFVRRGLHLNAYNAYQSIIRGGHILLTVRVKDGEVWTHGDKLDLLLCLNQDTMTRHARHLVEGGHVIYNADDVKPSEVADGVELCGLPMKELTDDNRNKLVQNTVALGAMMNLLGTDFKVLEEALVNQFKSKGQSVIDENVTMSRAGYDYAKAHFKPFPNSLPEGDKPLAVWTGNEALAMGGASAGVKFYVAYPMSPASGILHWMAKNARELGIMVRQIEDEIGVANVAIGAAHTGTRTMCATSGGGFALMTEAVGAAAMMEVPVVFIDVQRAGPSTGVPTKTEQGDLWQALGASQGDFERIVVAPKSALDAFDTMPEIFNLVDHYQCPAIVLSDLLISEGTFSVDPDRVNMHPEIDRGSLITKGSATDGYKRFLDTENGISPRAVPGLEGHVFVAGTDEHDEEGILISDEYTNPHKRRQMVEKRARKLDSFLNKVSAPAIEGPNDADVTLVGWGSTDGVIRESIALLAQEGIKANQLSIKWIKPFHADAVTKALSKAKKVLVVENNYSGQFYRYLRSETGISVHGHIRKYDGEPLCPHHVVNGVKDHMGGKKGVVDGVYVPFQEILV